MIRSFPSLDIRSLISCRRQIFPLLDGDRVRFYASGRAALYHIARHLNAGSKNVFLLPAYHCGVEIEAVLRAGSEVDFYPIKKDLTIDMPGLFGKINETTRGVIVIHYFGFPQEMSSLLRFCKEKNITLVEDCAHAFYSRDGSGRWIGTSGDFALFSMRKTIFLPNGGAVLANGKETLLPERGKEHTSRALAKSTIRNILEFEAKRGKGISGCCRLILELHQSRQRNGGSPERLSELDNGRSYYDVAEYHYENDISFLSSLLLHHDDYYGTIDARRRNYLLLQDRLAGRLKGNLVFPELPTGVCPLCFPLFIAQRDAVAEKMLALGVEPFVFGRVLHPLIREDEFFDSHHLADSIIGLPIHQQLTPNDIETVAGALFQALEG